MIISISPSVMLVLSVSNVHVASSGFFFMMSDTNITSTPTESLKNTRFLVKFENWIIKVETYFSLTKTKWSWYFSSSLSMTNLAINNFVILRWVFFKYLWAFSAEFVSVRRAFCLFPLCLRWKDIYYSWVILLLYFNSKVYARLPKK